MKIDFTAYFKRYEVLVASADEAFNRVKNEFSDCVSCKVGCSDCCYALFDLTLIEAIYIKDRFNENFEGDEKSKLINKADKSDRELYRLKKNAFKKLKSGIDDLEILGEMSMERMRCPLLNEKNECNLYEFRPLTCRIYGIPTSTQGKSHICGLTNFEEGKPYPTMNMDKLYQHLYQISLDLVMELKTKYFKMADILVPVSSALLTDYTPEYFNLVGNDKEEKKE